MSYLSYGGISLSLIRTNSISYEPVRAEDNTYLYTNVTIDVSGIINPKATSYFPDTGGAPPAVRGVSPSDTVRAIRHTLSQERQPLVYDVGDADSPMIQIDGLDAANGPVPGPFTLTRIDGTKTFHVNFRVTCALIECPGSDGSSPSALLANRYSQSHDIDANHYTTIRTIGQAFFNTSVLENAHDVADHYRSILLPPVAKGFKRMAVSITATPSRNALTYQVIDTERSYDLGETGPTGTNSRITDVSAIYAVSSTGVRDGGPVSFMSNHSLRIQVSGSKAASNWVMTQFAFRLAQARLPIGDPTRGFISQISVMQDLTKRFIGLDITMRLAPPRDTDIPGVDTDILRQDQVFADQGGLNPAFPSRGGTAGTYQNEILASAWKSACSPTKQPSEGDYTNEDDTPSDSENTGPIVTAAVSDQLPSVPQNYSTSQSQAPFTDYKIDILYERKTWMMQAPIAGRVNSAPQFKSLGPSTGDGGASPGSSYGADSGIIDGPADSEILTLARPTMRRIIEWTGERVGEPPIVPSSIPVDPNLVLIDDTHVTLAEPNLLADGVSLCFRASGRYVYALKKSTLPDTSLPFPVAPWMDLAYGELGLTADLFQGGIIDATSDGYVSPGLS